MTTELENRLAATLTRIAESTSVPPLPVLEAAFAAEGEPDGRTRRTPRFARHRAALAGIAAIVVFGGGLSIAAAAGVQILPGPVARALWGSPEPGTYNAEPATTRKLFTVPGPGGVPLTLWYSDANDDGYCVNLTATVAADPSAPGGVSADPRRMPRNGAGAGGCGGTNDAAWHQFGGEYTGAGSSESATFIVHVPGVASVRLQFADGNSRPLPVADSWTAGWMTQAQNAQHPVLVGYAADGSEAGRFDLAPVLGDGG